MEQNMQKRVKEYLALHKDRIVQDVADLCRIPSEESAAKPGAPFGENCAAAVAAAADMAAAMGFETEIFADRGYALAHWGSGEKTIGFFGHCDVVPAGTGWTLTEPYEPKLIDGTLVARGATDNKNGVVASLWTVKAVRELGLPVKSRLMVFMGGDEESGMEDAVAFANSHPMPDLCIVPDSNFPVCNGEKGVMDVTYRCKKPFKHIISIDGGVAPNVIIGEATAKVKHSGELLGEINLLAEKSEGYTVESDGEIITIRAKGRSGHASRPEGSLNAARMLVDLLVQCGIDPSDKEIVDDMATALSDDYGQAIGIAAEDSETGKTTAACGMVKTEGGHVEISLNPRYTVSVGGEFFAQGFEDFFRPRGWERTLFRDSKGYCIPASDPRVQILMDIYREHSGDTGAEAYTMGGGTYARKLKNALAFGPDFADAKAPYPLPPGHGTAHQPDEFLHIDNLIRAIDIYINMLLEVEKVL